MSEYTLDTVRVRAFYAEVRSSSVDALEAFEEFDDWLAEVQEDARVAGYIEGYKTGVDDAIEHCAGLFLPHRSV